MHAWWWRSVAACASVVTVAGLVAAVAVASDGDRVQRERSALSAGRAAATTGPSPAATSSVAPPAPVDDEPVRSADPAEPRPAPGAAGEPARAVDRTSGASVAVPAGWRPVREQRIVPVPPGRFGAVLAAGNRAVVLVGPLDPARVRTPATVPALEAEARRLAGAFGDGAAPSATRLVGVRDDDAGIAGRAAWTSLRRADGGDRRTAGALVRVTTVDAAPGARAGVVLLAVALPGPTQAADARAAEQIVRSLEPVRPRSGASARPALAPDVRPAAPRPPAVAPRTVPPNRSATARPVPPRPAAPRPSPPRPARPATPPTGR